ncbi:type VI secretion system tip protein VgrG [Sansalvadorimonas sp. 2012CJ34-2]|uniref:Type VI secretion system tip protein VgrG n=1 Tax=Parendozoicomonas callyspongiae TaxID=2942213 RepID=A0ABT0PCT3_9GAMM|nr:type VI secretion system tip protein TssI/VgrG [Sansalvadorimonas sp. 2012CJ34-2]MCL6268841.1 type VI secretion system tip protein VgrG [Sansalvadorimonas sp. 2012CJ34-2]
MGELSAVGRVLTAEDCNGTIHVCRGMVFHHAVNNPLSSQLQLLCRERLDADQILGKALKIKFQPKQSDGNTCYYFHGLVESIQAVTPGIMTQHYVYQLKICSWFDLLSRAPHYRIFQDADVSEIFDKVLSEYSFEHPFRFCTKPASKRKICTQANETDQQFLTRLLSEEGLSYYFSQAESAHEMIICTTNSEFSDAPHSTMRLPPLEKSDQPSLTNWEPLYSLGAASQQASSWDSERAKAIHGKSVSPAGSNTHGLLAAGHVWEGQLQDEDALNTWAERQAERDDCASSSVITSTTIPGFNAGMKFSLEGHSDPKQNREYVITSVEHSIRTPDAEITNASANYSYVCDLQLQPVELPLRPAVCPRPQLAGVHSALVKNADDKECASDDQAKVQVVFHWDKDAETPCWLPVMRSLAGTGFGTHILPRTGQEVVVSFLDGDPDRPVIIGTLHNGANKPPETNAEVIQLVTRSTPDGGKEDGHILRLTDTKDSEELFVQAQKDMNIEVKNNLTTKVTAEHTLEIEKTSKVSVKEDAECSLEGALAVETKKAVSVKTDDALSFDVTKAAEFKSKDAITLDGKEGSFKAKTKVTIEAPQGITLKAGSSEIQLTPSGIAINGMKVTLDAKTVMELKALNIKQEATAQAALKGLIVQIAASTLAELKGDAMVMAKGGITMIN